MISLSWYSEAFDIDALSSPHEVEVPAVPIQGTVKLGKNPLRATLRFGGEFGAVSIPLESDEQGEFSGFLPRAGVWQVMVEAKDPPVRRHLENVDVRKSAQGKAARVDIRLPNAALTGEVVDERGIPPEFTMLSVRSGEGSESFYQVPVEKDGHFRLYGLPARKILLQAQAAPDLLSDTVEVSLEEDAEHPPVKLVMRHQVEISGQVVSSAGPVPGASVMARPADWSPLFISVPRVTNAEGRFSFRLPAGTRQMRLQVFPPGFSLRFLDLALTDRPITIAVDQLGGALAIESGWSKSASKSTNERFLLLHAGDLIAVPLLLQMWGGKWEEGENGYRILLSHLEPGDYAVCLASESDLPALRAGALPQSRCAGGVLSQLGQLTLKVPRVRP